MSSPKQMNIGSGKDFKDDYLNIDYDDYWSPDIIYDLNMPLPQGISQRFSTKRFDEIEIAKGMFNKIIAFDIFEHIRNLPVCMKSCLDLLKVDGILEINVPYDLYLGALPIGSGIWAG